MAKIKQIAVYNGNNWTVDNIAANANNITIRNSSNRGDAYIRNTSNLNQFLLNTFQVSNNKVEQDYIDSIGKNKVLISDDNGKIVSSSITTSELNQLNNKITKPSSELIGKPENNLNPSFGDTIKISQVSQNIDGQISLTDRNIIIPNATATNTSDGLMSAVDKQILDTLGGITGVGELISLDHLFILQVVTSNQPNGNDNNNINYIDWTSHCSSYNIYSLLSPFPYDPNNAIEIFNNSDTMNKDLAGSYFILAPFSIEGSTVSGIGVVPVQVIFKNNYSSNNGWTLNKSIYYRLIPSATAKSEIRTNVTLFFLVTDIFPLVD